MDIEHSSHIDLGDDHALDRVPDGERHSWLQISWSTAGIVTTLVQLFVGALVTFVAGMKLGIAAGLVVTLAGSALGSALGHVACRSGLSSTMIARRHGFGTKGSALASSIFAFMIIGFIAAENMLLYKGFLFFFGFKDELATKAVILGLMAVAWIALTSWGFELVTRFSSLMLVGFLALLVFMLARIVGSSGQSVADVLSFGCQLPPDQLAALGADTPLGKLAFGVNVLIGSAGALALIDADLGRYARSSRDIAIAAVIGNLFMDVIMLAVGGVVMYAGLPALTEYYVQNQGLSPAEVAKLAFDSPDRIATAFIVFGGIAGAILMVLAQSKAQVLNTYSSSLALTNLADSLLGWKPGRMIFVVLANLLSMLFLAGNVIVWFNAFLTLLGVLTTCFSAIMLADYFLVERLRPRPSILGSKEVSEPVNWAGVIALGLGFVAAHYLLRPLIPIEFFSALAVSLFVYPLLRLYVLPPAWGRTAGAASLPSPSAAKAIDAAPSGP